MTPNLHFQAAAELAEDIQREIFVSDGEGQLWAAADPQHGVRLATPGEVINGLPADVAGQLSEQGRPFEVSQDYEYMAKRFYVDPSGRGVLIFAQLPNNE